MVSRRGLFEELNGEEKVQEKTRDREPGAEKSSRDDLRGVREYESDFLWRSLAWKGQKRGS